MRFDKPRPAYLKQHEEAMDEWERDQREMLEEGMPDVSRLYESEAVHERDMRDYMIEQGMLVTKERDDE